MLQPFVNDPLIEWSRRIREDGTRATSGVRDLEYGRRSLETIDGRLRGVYNLKNPNTRKIRRTDGGAVDGEDENAALLPLGVEGQAEVLLKQATSRENLVQMYVGWMPWL